MKDSIGQREYHQEFSKLNVNKRRGKVAPHKAILLLTVIDLIESGDIDSPFVPLTGTVEKRFKATWRDYVKENGHFKCQMQYPFYHLSSSSFWTLQKLSTFEDRVEYSSLAMLKRSFSGALLNKDLFNLLCDEENRLELKRILVDTYLQPSSSTTPIISNTLLSIALALFCVA